VGRIWSGVRVSASSQKKIPAGFCPTRAKNGGGLRLRGFCSGGRFDLPPPSVGHFVHCAVFAVISTDFHGFVPMISPDLRS